MRDNQKNESFHAAGMWFLGPDPFNGNNNYCIHWILFQTCCERCCGDSDPDLGFQPIQFNSVANISFNDSLLAEMRDIQTNVSLYEPGTGFEGPDPHPGTNFHDTHQCEYFSYDLDDECLLNNEEKQLNKMAAILASCPDCVTPIVYDISSGRVEPA